MIWPVPPALSGEEEEEARLALGHGKGNHLPTPSWRERLQAAHCAPVPSCSGRPTSWGTPCSGGGCCRHKQHTWAVSSQGWVGCAAGA